LTYLRTYQGKIPVEDYFHAVRDFHGFLAPGVVLGGLMVDWALETMAPSRLLDSVAETRKCLPDAVQLLTPCTVGNGWLRVLDWGKLALTLYDKETMEGARIHVDVHKMGPYPLLKSWAMKEKSRRDNPLEPLVDEILTAGRDVLTCTKGILERVPGRVALYGQPRLCFRCGEAFRYGSDTVCAGCPEPYFSPR
jgi:formylmethanofuran dehydrogenase subunit E